jgi:apolipoprotein N-acyltransferase
MVEGSILKRSKEIIPPAQVRATHLNIVLAVLSGILLGFAFPPSPFYSLAYVAFVPFFFLMDRMKSYGQLTRYGYLFIFVFHVITVYWTGGFTHMKDPYLMMAGSLLLVLHPFFYLPTILCSYFVRKRLGTVWGMVSFIFLWVAYEYFHSLGEFSFPWMTIGNSQSYDLFRIQIAEYTSVYGLSFLILAFNVLAFLWIVQTTRSHWKPYSFPSVAALLGLLLFYVLPWVYGNRVVEANSALTTERTLRIGLIQPNIDPFEKWGEGTTSDPFWTQMGMHLNATRSFAHDSVDLVLWCETAIPTRILLPSHGPEWQVLKSTLDSIGIPVLTGFPYTEFFDSLHAPITAHRVANSSVFYEDYNAVMLVPPRQPVNEIYKKMRLVPFAERIPYAENVPFLIAPLRWSVGISGWGLGRDTVLFSLKSRGGIDEHFAGIICYESAYPDFVRQFVLRGAEFIVVLTNDSWWGNSSGTYQHIAFAPFRAIENRRWIVQCANGGISAFVDPVGRIYHATKMYTSAAIDRSIEPRSGETFYDRHGDLFAKMCVALAAMILLGAIISSFYFKKRT